MIGKAKGRAVGNVMYITMMRSIIRCTQETITWNGDGDVPMWGPVSIFFPAALIGLRVGH